MPVGSAEPAPGGAGHAPAPDAETTVDAGPPISASWHPLLLFGLFGASWAAAWYVVWSFAQTIPWLAAWAVGGALSGLATGSILKKSPAAIGWDRVRVVALGWTGAWVIAWIAGSSIAALIAWAVRSDLLAGIDPNHPAYGVGRVATWSGAGLLTGTATQPEASPSRWAMTALTSLAWAVAGAAGHGLFWALDSSLHTPGARFAVSGLCEGAIGGGMTLWLLHQAHSRMGGRIPTRATVG